MPFVRKLGVVAACLLTVCLARGQQVDEYQVKAAFVSSFASFVEWPADAFKDARDPFHVCVLGRNPFGHTLQGLLEGKVVSQRALLLREVSDIREAAGCHILFVSSSERLRTRGILASIKNRCVLSVGDTNDFISKGGVANLKIENGKVRIEINAEAAKESNLHISSHLLQLAKVVK